jgi:putative transposase
MVGFIMGRGQSTWRACAGSEQSLVGQRFWARGFLGSTVGRDEAVVREYIRNQELEDQRLEQLKMR